MRPRSKAQPAGPVHRIPVPGGDVRVDLRPEEVLFPRSTVTVEVRKALDPESARRTIGVARAANAVKVGRERRTATWSPPDDLAPGRHVFLVGPLRSARGAALEPALEIPFHFVQSSARVPAGVAVGSIVRARVGSEDLERLPLGRAVGGSYVELMKGTDRRTGAPVELAFDETGKRIDATRLLRRLQRAKAARLGKLDESLHRRLASARPPGAGLRRRLGAHRRRPRPPAGRQAAKGRGARAPRRRSAARKRSRRSARGLAERVQEAGGRDVRADEAAPVVFASMRKADIAKLAERGTSPGIFLYETEGIDDLGNSIAIANSDDVHAAGSDGAGVNVAVWEDGPTSTADLVITARFDSSPTTSDHSQLVHGIIRNSERNRPHGHAPGCALHSANSKDLDALRWAVRDRGCTVVNQSFHRPSEPESGGHVVRRRLQGLARPHLAVPDDRARRPGTTGPTTRTTSTRRATSSSTTRASTASRSATTTTRPAPCRPTRSSATRARRTATASCPRSRRTGRT